MDSQSPVATCIAGQECGRSGEIFFVPNWRLRTPKAGLIGGTFGRDDVDAASPLRSHRRSATGEAA